MATTFKPDNLAQLVFFVRGEKVMLDADLAMLYGVEARSLNQAVARNRKRFPADFIFQLTVDEFAALKSQTVTSKSLTSGASGLRSQTVISKAGRGGRRYRPYAFTEQGVAMLSSVLRSQRAIEVNIAIMRTFVRLRELLLSNTDLARKLAALENKYDAQFKVVFDAIRADASARNAAAANWISPRQVACYLCSADPMLTCQNVPILAAFRVID